MTKFKVKYTVTMEQTVEWPDDEMEDFNDANLHWNLSVEESEKCGDGDLDIISILKDGEEFEF